MADAQLKSKIKEVLKRSRFSGEDDYVYVSDGDGADDIHVVVVSPQLHAQNLDVKQDLIWSVLTRDLDDQDWGKVSLWFGVSPEEVMRM